jgi:(1->4)-alpha-D-glucan 1-alpha-D-glucosylmutase
VAVKCAAPGVTDVYQGTELWELSLVDPDNRRPVDFERRRRLLGELQDALAEGPEARLALARRAGAAEALPDGTAKLLLLSEALRLRRVSRALFAAGEHRPLAAAGPHARHVFAFARVHEGRAVVCAVPRLVLGLLDEGGGAIRWRGELPLADVGGPLRDVVTGRLHRERTLPLAALFGDFPVALLASE